MRDKIARDQLYNLIGVPAEIDFFRRQYYDLRNELEALKVYLKVRAVHLPAKTEMRGE